MVYVVHTATVSTNIDISCFKITPDFCIHRVFTEKAQELTQKGKGKHHIGDFLPPDELKKFSAKVKAVKGETSLDNYDFSDYAEHKIQEDNIGYKMLKQAGWQEGMGLGSQGQGITAPVDRYVHNSTAQM